MPELPEVQTTVNGLKKRVVGLTITDVWTNYNSPYFTGSETIKDPTYYTHFRKEVLGKTVVSIERRAKNILINLDSGYTILVHMKMTGHLLFGRYSFMDKKCPNDPWKAIEPESLKDPFNRHIRLMLTLKKMGGKNKSNTTTSHLALSDMRRFAKVTLVHTDTAHESTHLAGIGPEPLEKDFTYKKFCKRLLLRPKGKIKQVLLDQTIIAGIGNIYSDESLWRAGIHPLTPVSAISAQKMKALYTAVRETLSRGIDFGGDSMSDYRNIDGERGAFQDQHLAYRKTGTHCMKKGCGGTITRIVVGGRGTHYCNIHQQLSTFRNK